MRGACRVRGCSPGQDRRTARCAWGLFQQHEMLPLGKDAIRGPQKPRAADPAPMNCLDPSSNVMIKTVPKALDFCGSLGSKWSPQLRVAETQRGVSGSPSWEQQEGTFQSGPHLRRWLSPLSPGWSSPPARWRQRPQAPNTRCHPKEEGTQLLCRHSRIPGHACRCRTCTPHLARRWDSQEWPAAQATWLSRPKGSIGRRPCWERGRRCRAGSAVPTGSAHSASSLGSGCLRFKANAGFLRRSHFKLSPQSEHQCLITC